MEEQYIPTGNERISIPKLGMSDGSIHDFTFLHMGCKGLIEVRGTEESPLMKPFICNEEIVSLNNIKWGRENWWIPTFTAQTANFNVKGIILAPIDERGFIYRLSIQNNTNVVQKPDIGLTGCWASTVHCINEDKPIDGVKHAYKSGWNDNVVFDLRNGVSIFSFAPMVSVPCKTAFHNLDNTVCYTISSSIPLLPQEEKAIDFFWGIGFEEVASTTSAKEMLRKGFEHLYDSTLDWLKKRSAPLKDESLNALYHTNLFFNFFFSSGLTLDTEEFVLVTSRSPRYYVSAAYWDRDSLLWSFPAILLVDAGYARDMLDYVFTRQIKNVGVHSRYIDGTVLEPGFELDELCAPIIALYNYVNRTGDKEYLREPHILNGVRRILKILKTKKHPEIDLYETFLQPTDDMHVYRYITYDNVLVWRSLNNIAALYIELFSPAEVAELLTLAERVKAAIEKHCIKEYKDKRIYGWSVDLKGNFDVYDEPPGSLQLLAFYGFCDREDEVFKNTVDVIRNEDYPYSFSKSNFAETGCPHAPHPWVLSISNSLLFGRIEHCTDILKRIVMDNYIACESVDENTGECVTGAAFATCAGFLAYAMRTALE
ncbi:MAG: glycoside hydrolase family 125 protein [Clostridia bacterium]|nr:glycoside hydrolase family 125 protein [Clostridia bacterium]